MTLGSNQPKFSLNDHNPTWRCLALFSSDCLLALGYQKICPYAPKVILRKNH